MVEPKEPELHHSRYHPQWEGLFGEAQENLISVSQLKTCMLSFTCKAATGQIMMSKSWGKGLLCYSNKANWQPILSAEMKSTQFMTEFWEMPLLQSPSCRKLTSLAQTSQPVMLLLQPTVTIPTLKFQCIHKPSPGLVPVCSVGPRFLKAFQKPSVMSSLGTLLSSLGHLGS